MDVLAVRFAYGEPQLAHEVGNDDTVAADCLREFRHRRRERQRRR